MSDQTPSQPDPDEAEVEAVPPTFFGSVDELAQSLIATEAYTPESSGSPQEKFLTSDPSVEDPAVGNFTIDGPQNFAASGSAVDLPPASRPPRRGGGKSGLPERVGKFLIKGELGRGAFGVVYLGFDEELQRNVAIKVSLVADPKLQERLRIEASKVAQVESAGIVPVYHIGTTQSGAFFIVQKYIKGTSLRDVVKQGPLSPARATRLMADIALGLEPAHLQDILHRDLKPDNILMEENGRAWIADFGLAISESEQTTGKRELAGTLPYMSPEQIRGRIDFLDPRSDIWALGVMYYELLTGKLPFSGKTRQVLTDQICERDPRPLQQRFPDHLTEAMNQVFSKCCAKQPSDRFATVREFAVALDELLVDGMSDQNVLGESMDSRFGQSTLAYSTANSRFGSARSRSGSALGSTEQTGVTEQDTQRGTQRDSTQGSQVASHHSDVAPTSGIRRLLQTTGTLVTVVALSILASAGYQRFSGANSSVAANEDSGDVNEVDVAKNDIDGDPSAVALKKDSADEDLSASDLSASDLSSVDTPGGDAMDAGPDEQEMANVGPKIEPPRLDADGSQEKPWVVATDGSGSHATIAEAIAAGPKGAYIQVQPGLYVESIRITAPVHLVGTRGPGGEIGCEIENDQAAPITIDCPLSTDRVVIESFFVDGKGRNRNAKFNAIDVFGGTLLMESCELETSSQNCVKVHASASLGVKSCRFVDSNDFSISTKDHEVVQATDCEFRASGIQLVGGTGRIRACTFFGKKGVHVSRNTQLVSVLDSEIDGASDFGISATDGGKLRVDQTQIIDCEIGVWATSSQVPENDAAEGRPIEVELVGATIQDCVSGLIADGGASVKLSGFCSISGGDNGVGVGQATVTADELLISGCQESGVMATSPQSKLTLTRCNLTDCPRLGIKWMAGTLAFTGGTIEGSQYATEFGDADPDQTAGLVASLEDVELKDCSVGMAVFAGKITSDQVSFAGGTYGVLGKAPQAAELSDPPTVDLTLRSSKFADQSDVGVLLTGDAVITIDDATWKSLEAGTGAQTLKPAKVNFID